MRPDLWARGRHGPLDTQVHMAQTYPVDVPLAVVTVAASREGVVLPIKLLWLLRQEKNVMNVEGREATGSLLSFQI